MKDMTDYLAKIKAAEAVPESYANKEALIKETQAFAKELIDAWGSLGGMIDRLPLNIESSGRGKIVTKPSLPKGIGYKESHLAQTIFNNPE